MNVKIPSCFVVPLPFERDYFARFLRLNECILRERNEMELSKVMNEIIKTV